jgi:hypothetical protein
MMTNDLLIWFKRKPPLRALKKQRATSRVQMHQGTEDGLEKETLQALHKPGSPALVLHIVSEDGLQTLWTRPEPHPLSTCLAEQKIHLESQQSGY